MALILDPSSAGTGATGQAGDTSSDLIKDSDTNGFVADVIETSMQVPVMVDFWAPWCGPCKQLSPLLEKLVRNAGGLVRLVKINVDENRELAMQMNVQSIPAVFGFVNGRPVDYFAGALPESQIRSFIDRLTGGAKAPIDVALEQAKAALEAGDTVTASGRYAEVLAQDPANPAAIAGMIRCFVASKDYDKAREVIARLPEAMKKESEVAGAISAVELLDQAGDTGNLAELRQRLERNENDHQARFDLALALYGEGDSASAVDELIALVQRDREWNDQAARKQLLRIFEALGGSHQLTVDGRRRLASILFS